MLTGSEYNTAWLWDVETGRELQRFKGSSSGGNSTDAAVYSVAFSPDGRRVLTGNADHTVRLWDVATGKELRRFVGHTNRVSSVAFSPNGRNVLTGSDDKTVRLWDAETGTQLRSFAGFTGALNVVAFSPDGRTILTGSDNTVLLWEVSTGRLLRHFEERSGRLSSVAFSPDGRRMLAGSDDGTARLWDVGSGNVVQDFEGMSNAVTSVAFSPDGRSVLTAESTAWLWDVQTGKELQHFQGQSHLIEPPIISIAFSSDGTKVLLGNTDNTARLWDVHSGKELQHFDWNSSRVFSMFLSPDGSRLLTGSDDGTARLWDADTSKQLQIFVGHSYVVNSAAISPDGLKVATASGDNTARLWDVGISKEVRHFLGHSAFVHSVTFSPDGRRLLTGSDDGSARLWDVESGQQLQRFQHSGVVASVAFSHDGRKVLTGSWDKTARLWDAETGAQLQTFKRHTDHDLCASTDVECGLVDSVAISPDGRWILTGSFDKTARLWDTQTGAELRHFDTPSEAVNVDVTSVAFSQDAHMVLTGSSDRSVLLWDAETGKELQHYDGCSAWVNSVAFSPDGRKVLAGGDDGTARLWDRETGKELQVFTGHSDRVTSVAFWGEHKVLTASWDGTTKLWDADSGKELISLVSFMDGGWAVVDPAGHYDASDPDNSESLYWVTDNLRTIDLGQLKNEYFTPGLLARVMKNERLPDVTGMDGFTLPPILSVMANYNPAMRKLDVKITNDSGGVGKLLVKVNDRLLRTIDRPPLPMDTKSITLPIDLSDAPFVAGDNIIRITAYNATNRIESRPAEAHYTKSASARGVTLEPSTDNNLNAGRFFAVVVGTSTFSFGDPAMNLTFPARDAESFSTGLRLGAERLYGKDQVWMRVLTSDFKAGAANTGDGLPTKENIRAAFDEVRRLAKPEDTLVVYLSGHGAMSRKNRDLYYYLTADARTLNVEDDPTLLDVSTVSSAELFDWLREPVKTMPLKQVVILDTCAAGAASQELTRLAETREISPDRLRAIELAKDATGTFILMGSAADKVSYEASKYGEGLLTYALLNGMRMGPFEDGSRLDVNEWFGQTSKEVPDMAKSIGGIQKPLIAAPKGRDFPVAMLTVEDRAKIPLALPMPQLLRVVCEDENQVDPLHLNSLLREQLRALNYSHTRGSTDKTVEYLDATEDDLPGAFSPRLRYQISGDKVAVLIRLVSDEKPVAEEMVTGSSADLQSLAEMLANKIVAMAMAIKKP